MNREAPVTGQPEAPSRRRVMHDSLLGWRFAPNLRVRADHEGGGFLIRTNSDGFRCEHEFVREKAAGTFRVLLFGDSFTAGNGVSNARRYSDLLEERIPGLEVFNFGISGVGTDQQYLAYRKFGAELEHDLVVVAVYVENIRRNMTRYRPWWTKDGVMVAPRPYFTLTEENELELHGVPVPTLRAPQELEAEEQGYVDHFGRFKRMRAIVRRMGPRVTSLAQRLSRYQPVPEYDRPDDPAWLLMRAILETWADESKTPMLVFTIPLPQHLDETTSASGYQARFAELSDPPRIVVHDPLPDLLAYPKRERRGFRFPIDIHATVEGHRALADSLERTLRSLMPEPSVAGQSGRS